VARSARNAALLGEVTAVRAEQPVRRTFAWRVLEAVRTAEQLDSPAATRTSATVARVEPAVSTKSALKTDVKIQSE
jgi:hypothetical protein